VGATGIFVAAAAVGASQNRPRDAAPTPVVAAPSLTARTPRTPVPERVRPERSISGTIREVSADNVVVTAMAGREWRISPAAGALIRLNGRMAKLDTLRAGDGVVILGQAQGGPGNRFLAHAITARRK
jgi:hypothetical protein